MSEGAGAEAGRDKRAWTEEALREILGHMGVRARVEVKDVAGDQPSISVALFPEEEIPGVVAGKRSQVVEALQFLLNKIVNRGPEKRWINVGLGGHPEPRPVKEKKEARAAPPPAPAQQQQQKKKKERAPRGEPKPRPAAESQAAASEPEVVASADPVLEGLGRELAQKAATFGRVYAVTALGGAERAQLAKGGEGVAGVRLKTEGEGRHRRLVFLPDEPKPMPKKSAMPDYDDEEEELEG